MSSALDELRARGRMRSHLVQALAEARAAEAREATAVEVAVMKFTGALAAYAGDDNEPRRLDMRARAVVDHRKHDDAVNAVSIAAAELRAFDEGCASLARDVHNPARVAAASALTALSIMSPELAKRCALGDATPEEIRAFLARVEQHNAASAFMRAEGAAACGDVALTIFLLPMLEAFVERDIAPINNLWYADQLPVFMPHAFITWCKGWSDFAPYPAQAANLRVELAAVRRAVEEHGIRTSGDFERLERERERERRHAPPAESPTVTSTGDRATSTHKPSERLQGMGRALPAFMRAVRGGR